MKVLFVGPTLPDATDHATGIAIRGPAVQGDIFRAVEEGATVIGIVDGGFEYTAPVWHKEILYALSAGARVLGAASMGALRAAECHSFGMIGIGRIFEEYRDGNRVDDSDVAQIHGPAALGWIPLSEPLVNITATLDLLLHKQLVLPTEAKHLEAAARALFFKERTWRSIIARALIPNEERRSTIAVAVQAHSVNLKRADAVALVETMSRLDAKRSTSAPAWTFERTTLWNEMQKYHCAANTSGHPS
jgi:hypothetical protein